MPKKTAPFYRECSPENCVDVRQQVQKSYDKKAGRPAMRRKGGLDVRVIEPARIPIIGELGEYTVSRHGLAVEIRRCYEFDYMDKDTHKQASQTCTGKRVINVPQKTLDCYRDVSNLLETVKKGKKGAPSIAPKILAAVACSRSGLPPTRVAEPISPSVISLITDENLSKVRKSLEFLTKTGKVKCGGRWLPILEEQQCSMPKRYRNAFDEFVHSEKEERKWLGFRRVFEDVIEPTSTDIPEAFADQLGKFVSYAPARGKHARRGRPMPQSFMTSAGSTFEV